MPSSIYNQLNGNNGFQPNPFQNSQNFLSSLQQFASSFRGDPQQMVMQLLQSGRMSQQDYNKYRQMAQQFKNNTKFF